MINFHWMYREEVTKPQTFPVHFTIGPPQVHIGPPQVHIGPPQVHIGPPQVHIGPPQVHIVPPQVHIGSRTGPTGLALAGAFFILHSSL